MLTLSQARIHKSIERFQDTQIADFTILTGANGSGKTHLLEAITNGSVGINGYRQNQIRYFDSSSFRANFEESSTPQNAHSEWKQFEKSFLQSRKQQLTQFSQSLRSIRGLSPEFSSDLTPLLSLPKEELAQHLENFQIASSPPETLANQIKKIEASRNQAKQNLLQGIGNNKFAITELCQSENANVLTLDDHLLSKIPLTKINQNPLQLKLASQFCSWFAAYEYNKINRYYSKEDGKDFEFLEDDEFFKIHGKEPWITSNDILSNANLPYRFNRPEGTIHDLTGAYDLKLIDTSNGTQVQVSELSFGEKALLALISLKYQSSSSTGFQTLPKVFLFDEIDAHLHPTFSDIVLKTLRTHFIAKDLKIILASHSPSTVALAEKNGATIYELDRSTKALREIDSARATQILSAGFLSVLPDDRIVITEAQPDASYYQKLHDRLVTKNIIPEVPALRFIGASKKKNDGQGGGSAQTKQWAEKLSDLGLSKFHGLVDWDARGTPNQDSSHVSVIKRSALENYIFDPITLLCLIVDNGGASVLPSWGATEQIASKLFKLPTSSINALIAELESILEIDGSDRVTASYHKIGDFSLSKEWIEQRGHDLSTAILGKMNQRCPLSDALTSNVVSKGGPKNIDYQTNKYLELIPVDLIDTLKRLKS